MTLAAFKAIVADEIGLGNSIESAIDIRIRQAIRWLERNEKLRYMHRWVTFTIDASAETPRLITPPSRIRSLDFFRLVLDENASGNSDFAYLRKVPPMDVENIPAERPTVFWFDGVDHMVLNSTPQENYTAEIGYWQYTNLAALTDDDEHWLFENAEDVLLQQTLIQLANYMKEDDSYFGKLRALRSEGLQTLIKAEDDFNEGPAQQASMGIYTG